MAKKNNLEVAIQNAAKDFALQIVEAVKSATLEELIALQADPKPTTAKRGPGRPPKKRGPGRPPKKRGPGRPPKAAPKSTTTTDPAKKRVVKNYPKCAYPSCKKNRFPRGKGFCGDHWRLFQEGKIKAATSYKKK